jgi:ABC-2 type transport system permease protein
MSGALFKRECRGNWKLLVIFMAVLSLYGSMIIAMFDPKLGESLNLMMESMPEIFALVGMNNPGSTLLEFIINYLYGFLAVVFPLIFTIVLSNGLVARYVDRGSLAYLLATPNTRRKIVLTQAAALLLGTAVLVGYLTGLCVGAGAMLFPGKLDVPGFLLVNAGLLGLQVFFAGLCFCFSCLFNDSKHALGWGAGLSIAFVLLQMLSQVGEKLEALKYATPLTLFDPSALIAGEVWALWGMGALFAAGLLLFGVGMAAFCRRDLPV